MNRWMVKVTVVFLCALSAACSDDTSVEKTSKQAQVAESEAELLYRKNCKVCHAQGINGAPILGNKKMWQPRLQKGVDALVNNAINGVGLMPAKGGKTHLSDEQIRSIVEFYIEELQS